MEAASIASRGAAISGPGIARAASRTVLVAAALSLAAAWVHLAFASSHWREWWGYGLFFVGTGLLQAVFAPAVLRWPRSQALALAGIALNAGIVLTYVVSRTYGVPLAGPHEGVPERAGAIDLVTTADEIVLIGILLALLGTRSRRWLVNLAMLGGIVLWAMRLTGHLA
jgi:hypothetical protein